MTSHRLKRSMRGALTATAVAVAVAGLTPSSAGADPASDALQKYNDLSAQAEKANDDLLKAKTDLAARQADLDKANSDLQAAGQAEDQAKGVEDQFRGQVDQLTQASFQGAQFNQLSALLVSNSQQDFLDRMSALSVLASDNKDALDKLSGAVQKADDAKKAADDAQHRAKDAADAAAKLADDVQKHKDDLDKQAADAKQAYQKLTSSQRSSLSSAGDMSPISVPPGAAGTAVQFALDQRGKMYVYGATGPDNYDCSGLTMRAWGAAGVTIPRTSQAQAGIGTPVSRANVQAGDLIIYYPGSNSHVAIAIDNTRAVHASTEGQPVKIANIDDIGPISTIRHIG